MYVKNIYKWFVNEKCIFFIEIVAEISVITIIGLEMYMFSKMGFELYSLIGYLQWIWRLLTYPFVSKVSKRNIAWKLIFRILETGSKYFLYKTFLTFYRKYNPHYTFKISSKRHDKNEFQKNPKRVDRTLSHL